MEKTTENLRVVTERTEGESKEERRGKRIRSEGCDDSDRLEDRSDKERKTRRKDTDGVSLGSPSSERRGRGRPRGRGRGRGRKTDGGDDKEVVSMESPSSGARGRARRGRKSDGGEGSKRSTERDMSMLDKVTLDNNSDGTKKYVGLTCHQCKNLTDKVDLVFCSKCIKKRYCYDCIERWYPERTSDQVRDACPFCMGNCNCRACLRQPLVVKKPSEKDADVKLKQLQYLLAKALPVLRDIYTEQNRELEIETSIRGVPVTESDITWSKLDPSERIYW